MNTTEELKLEPDASSFSSFEAFYPFYLNEHSNITCRRLHFLLVLRSANTKSGLDPGWELPQIYMQSYHTK